MCSGSIASQRPHRPPNPQPPTPPPPLSFAGTIDRDELGDVIRACGMNPTAKEIDEVMKKADTDKSGGINFDEFVKFLSGMAARVKRDIESGNGPEQQMREAFAYFDTDNSGSLDAAEFKRILTQCGYDRLTEEQFQAIMDDIDADKDGKVDVDEFISMCLKGMSWLTM